MTDSQSDCSKAGGPQGKSAWVQRGILGGVCALVIGVYAYAAHSGSAVSRNVNPADANYNLLVQGFRAGQLSVKKEVPPGLMRLSDPYDRIANEPYRVAPYHLHDLSYYKGRLYFYFGVTPALILFWPFVALTGHYLSERIAAVIFSAIGFLVSVGIVRALWHRYFSGVSVWVIAAFVLALGLSDVVPVILPRSAYNEVAISCGYMLTMLALLAIWRALDEPEQKCQWLAAASVAYGLAVGARPSLLFGAIILLVPVVQAWCEHRKILALLMAATGPILLIGLGLAFYNALRFANPLEFGWRYQLLVGPQNTAPPFRLRYLWFNTRVYFLEPARWSTHFPFVHEIETPPLPSGYDQFETVFGVLPNIPLVWLALAAPLAWRDRLANQAAILRWFAATLILLFGACALTLGFFASAIIRYEVDFVPALLLLAIIGLLGLERALAGQPTGRRLLRCGWGVLLCFSVAFNLLASVLVYANARHEYGEALVEEGHAAEAVPVFEEALRLRPDYVDAHMSLGIALVQLGRAQEALEHFQQALRIEPDFAGAHYNLGIALVQLGHVREAMEQWGQTLQLEPNFADAHYNLGIALAQTGDIKEAISHIERALEIKPDDADAHYNLAIALAQVGHTTEAIEHLQQALRINPKFTQAQNALARLQAGR